MKYHKILYSWGINYWERHCKTIVRQQVSFVFQNPMNLFVGVCQYESELLKEIIHGDKLSVDEYNYIVYSDSEIVFSIPQENVVYVKKG